MLAISCVSPFVWMGALLTDRDDPRFGYWFKGIVACGQAALIITALRQPMGALGSLAFNIVWTMMYGLVAAPVMIGDGFDMSSYEVCAALRGAPQLRAHHTDRPPHPALPQRSTSPLPSDSTPP